MAAGYSRQAFDTFQLALYLFTDKFSITSDGVDFLEKKCAAISSSRFQTFCHCIQVNVVNAHNNLSVSSYGLKVDPCSKKVILNRISLYAVWITLCKNWDKW